MRNPRSLCIFFLCLMVSPAGLVAQTQPASSPASSSTAAVANPKTPLEFFARARQLSDLEAAGIPFHLKATYVASGDAEFTGKGAFEEWWESKDTWRKEATLGSYKWVLINSGAKSVLYSTAAYIPLRLRQAIGAVPIQFESEADATDNWSVAHKELGGVDLTVLSKVYRPDSSHPRAQVVKTNYLTPEGLLRIQQNGNIFTLYNNFQPFQRHLIPRSIEIAFGVNRLEAISIDLLEKLEQGNRDVSLVPSLPQNLMPLQAPLHPAPGAMASKIIHAPPPKYPLAAMQQRIQGTVVIDATIDEKGNIREPYILSSGGKLLDDAALDAVRQWKYNPTTLDGKPIAVETTISTIYSLRE